MTVSRRPEPQAETGSRKYAAALVVKIDKRISGILASSRERCRFSYWGPTSFPLRNLG